MKRELMETMLLYAARTIRRIVVWFGGPNEFGIDPIIRILLIFLTIHAVVVTYHALKRCSAGS
jgi:hypothetical protein